MYPLTIRAVPPTCGARTVEIRSSIGHGICTRLRTMKAHWIAAAASVAFATSTAGAQEHSGPIPCASECAADGACTLRDGRCVATSDGACRQSRACRDGDDCYVDYKEGACYDGFKRNSTGLMATGIALSGVGAFATLFGVFAARCHISGDYDLCPFGENRQTAGIGIAVAGGALAVLGVTLAIAGGIEKDKRPSYGWVHTLTLRASGADLTWRF